MDTQMTKEGALEALAPLGQGFIDGIKSILNAPTDIGVEGLISQQGERAEAEKNLPHQHPVIDNGADNNA